MFAQLGFFCLGLQVYFFSFILLITNLSNIIFIFIIKDLRAVEAAAEAIGSLNPREFDIRFNPDAYVPEVIPSKCEVSFIYLTGYFCF